MKDEHIYAPSFKKALLEKIDLIRQRVKRPPKAKITQATEFQPPLPTSKVKLSVVGSTPPPLYNEANKRPSQGNALSPANLPTRSHPIKTDKTTSKIPKHKMTRETEEKILVFTLFFSVLAILLLGILLSYNNLL